MDIMVGAELRRVNNLVQKLPQTLLNPNLQNIRLQAAQRAWERDPKVFVEQFIPMFLEGLNPAPAQNN